MYYGYEAGTLVYMQELQQESWLEKKEKETWPLVSSTDKKTESESLGGQGLSKCGVFISLLTLWQNNWEKQLNNGRDLVWFMVSVHSHLGPVTAQ